MFGLNPCIAHDGEWLFYGIRFIAAAIKQANIVTLADIESVLAHKRLPGRGLHYELTVKYLDRPLGFLPDKLSLRDALTRGRDVVRAYFHQWKLGELQ
ncbi:hypothetical protein RI054_13g64720 [Pseudoscourfieldia marina]